MPEMEVVQKRLASHMEAISATEFFTCSVKLLRDVPFKRIRCLALGSPTQEFQALYQLAYLKLVAKEFSVDPSHVSLYDPVFSAEDIELLTELEHYVVTESDEDNDLEPETEGATKAEGKEDQDGTIDAETLYYMPHAPRSVTNRMLETFKLRWILGNDVCVTMGSLGKVKFFNEYPTLAKAVHLAEKNHPQQDKTQQNSEQNNDKSQEFTVVTRRRRGRPRKNQYVEPDIDYDLLEVYFDHVTVTRIPSPAAAPWNDSFSDLALNYIGSRARGDESVRTELELPEKKLLDA